LFQKGIANKKETCSRIANSVDVYRRFRHTALYGLDTTASREEAESSIEVAGETLISVKKLLRL